jgi:hypothetical protein
VVFNYAGLRVVVTRNEGEIFHTNNREWTFSLKRIKTEDLFKMLDYYFDEDEESIYSPYITVKKDESYESFRTRTIREEKLKELSTYYTILIISNQKQLNKKEMYDVFMKIRKFCLIF